MPGYKNDATLPQHGGETPNGDYSKASDANLKQHGGEVVGGMLGMKNDMKLPQHGGEYVGGKQLAHTENIFGVLCAGGSFLPENPSH